MKRYFACFVIFCIVSCFVSCSADKDTIIDQISTTSTTRLLEDTLVVSTESPKTDILLESQDEKTEAEVQETTEQIQSTEQSITVSKDENMFDKYCVYVNGNKISEVDYMKINSEQGYLLLPVNKVFAALGAKIEYEGASVSNIEFNEQEYILNIQNVTLNKVGSNVNFIIPTPGSKVFYECIGDELYLDNLTLRTVFMMMGTEVTIVVDHDSRCININQ